MSEPEKLQATARVQITVEVNLAQPWSAEATISQVHRQAQESALAAVHQMLEARSGYGIRVVGKPVVQVIMANPA